MFQDEPEVAMARWQCRPTVEDVARTARSVGSFAVRHGLRSAACEPTMRAVGEVLGYAADAPFAPDVEVEAASDGRWLTVIVRSPRHRHVPGAAAFAAATATADRVEWHAEGDRDMAVVMEFRTGEVRSPCGRSMRTRPGRPGPGRTRGCST